MNSKVQESMPKPCRDEFPVGMRVLVVDDDLTCLTILQRMLHNCNYIVTKCQRAEIALSKLRENKHGFDIVISDVHMPDMDGFKLLEHIGLEMDLPVIMMSGDDSPNVVMKGVTHGACDYLIKPVRIEALKNIWQHVYRKKKSEGKESEQAGSLEDGERQQRPTEEPDYSSSANEGNWKNSRKRKDEDEEAEDRDDSSALKKQRVVWSIELHQQFVAAVNQLGIDKAVPKRILELMNVPGLTRENVASHLQKYRLYLKRLSGVPQHQSNMNTSFINSNEMTFGPLSSLNAVDLHNLAALQAAGFGRSTVRPSLPNSLGDQRNLFSFENPEFRFGEGQRQHPSSSTQRNLLHGVPTALEPRQLVSLHQSAQSIGSMNMQLGAPGGQSNPLLMQMAHSQSRGMIPNNMNSSRTSRVPTSLGQAISSNGPNSGSLTRNVVSQSRPGPGYNPLSQTSSNLNFPMNQTAELPANSFPLGSTPRLSNLASTATFQDDVNSGIKGSRGIVPCYDMFSELQQHKSQDWALQNMGMVSNASQHANPFSGNLDMVQPVLVNDGFSSHQSSMRNIDASTVGVDHSNPQGICHNYNTHLLHNSVRVKTETIPDASQTALGTETFGQDDLMSVLLKQQLNSSGQTSNEFDLDIYQMDNISV